MVHHVIPAQSSATRTSSEKSPAQTDPSPTADEAEPEPAPEPDNILALDDDDTIQGCYQISLVCRSIHARSMCSTATRHHVITPQWDKCSLMTQKKGEQMANSWYVGYRLQALTHLFAFLEVPEVLGPSPSLRSRIELYRQPSRPPDLVNSSPLPAR